MPSLISVVIPAYNAERFIGQAIQSVLAQTRQPDEILVIDDGSTDKTKEVVLPFREQVTYFAQNNLGPSAARNVGIRAAKGSLICFQDADDFWTPEKLEVQVAYMEAHPEIAMTFSDHEEFNEEGVVLASYLEVKRKAFESFPIAIGPIENAFQKLVVENFISTPTVMVRRSCLDKTGLFDENLWSVEDRDLWLRISASFPIACIPRIFCKRRFHQGNISRQQELALQGRIQVLKKNWELYPALVPDSVWRKQLSEYFFSLGFLLLKNGRQWEAFQIGVKNLSCLLGAQNGYGAILFQSVILKSIGLLCASLLGWKISQFLWKPIKNSFHVAL